MALGVTVVVLGGAEATLRATVPETDLVFTYERPDGMLMHVAGAETYLPRPHAEAVVPDGPNNWRYRMNGAGLRADRDYPEAKPAGTTRYLALGDSWIFGESTDQSLTLPAQLEAVLAQKTGTKVEVLDAGVPGAAGYDMLVRYHALRDQWQLDGLVLGAPKNARRQRASAAEREVWYGGGGAPYVDLYLYLVLRRLLTPYTRASLRELDADDWTAMIADTAQLTKEARADGLSVVVGVWPPDRDLALKDTTGGVPYARFADAVTPLGGVVTGAALATQACWGWVDHAHPSEAGYRVLAEVLADRMTGGADPGGLRTSPRCEDVPGNGPGKNVPNRTRAQADATRVETVDR